MTCFHGMGRGYGVIWKLHHHSPVGVFQSCRSKFDLEDVHGVDLAAIEQRLTRDNATLMLFINKSKRTDLRLADMHSIAVACDPNGRLFYYDTGLGKAVENFGTLADLGECGDRFLLIGKKVGLSLRFAAHGLQTHLNPSSSNSHETFLTTC